MTRSRVRGRRLGGILAASLFILSAMPGLVTADNNSRTLWIGAPDLAIDADNDGIPDNNGILAPTPITVPVGSNVHSTFFAVEILSTDNQNLAHTVLTVTVPTQAHMTLSDPFDPGPNSITDADVCTRVDGADIVITCDYGSLAAFGERTIAFIANVDASFNTATQAPTFVSAKVETNNETGPNQQLFTASSGSFQVQAFNANHVASWVPSGTNSKVFSTASLGDTDAGNLSSTVSFDTSANETFSLSDGTNPSGKYACPTTPVVLTCQPDFSEAVTTSGSFSDSPYFTWTLKAKVPKTYSLAQGFIAHYLTGATDYDWILFFKAKSSFCGSLAITPNGHCIQLLTLTKYDKTFNLLTLVVVMDHQGGSRY